ncbi:MAG: IPT/TIG domain-containing protein, partial [Tepidanaerobacteraceae bacterium]
FTERAELPEGYTYIPRSIKPEVQKVVPDEIHVVKTGSNGDEHYILPQDLMIAIYGRNFTVSRYTVEGETRVSYPIVKFGDVEINKNKNSAIELFVMDDNGNIMDGTPGSESGNRILAIIPGGSEGIEIPKEYIDTNVSVVVTNPIRNSAEPGLSSEEVVMVKFIEVKEDKVPVIASVTPNVVTVDGGETVTVSGSNFAQDVKVFIDGREVSGVTRAGDGKTLTFKAPPGREGATQLQVMNPGGGTAIAEFNYVKTYTDPKITDFSPKRGNTGTLVLVKGDNFLPPDPTSTGLTTSEIYKLIGSRILLQNRDINEYNINPDTQRIELRYYASPEGNEILRIGTADDGRKYLHIADYWHSVVFKDGSGKFYTLRQDVQGNAILSDGVRNTYRLNVKYDSGEYKIFASKEGASDYLVEIETAEERIDGRDIKVTTLTINEPSPVKLYMQTLYRVDSNGIIVGNNVKVVDKNTILFKVPILSLGDGYYDLTVLNPDTKRDSRTGTQGFYYYTLPDSQPRIERIVPDKGSIDGGYTIDIIGSDFKDDGTFKSRVFINGVEVKAEDTFVSVDGRTITVRVPPFTGDLSKEMETDRITVPVVVLNPDGASASKEDGFTYMVPTSYPEITRIVPARGSAAGKDIVEIIGKDFRFFEPYSDDNRNQTRDPNEPYNDLNGNGKWDDFRGKTIEDLREELREQYGDDDLDSKFENIVLPVLPKVYFGNKVAEIIEFDDGYLKVRTPAGSAGDVDVYVVNNDSGISNKVKFTYLATNPVITRMVPPEGKKQGGDRVEIFGSNFVESELKVLNKDGELEILPMVQVRFGDVTNRDIPREEENSGRIDNRRTTVNLPGGIRVEYRDGDVFLRILEGGREYVTTIKQAVFDGSPLFVSARLLKDGENPYPYDELIRLEISDRRLFVERGYAPKVEFLNGGQLVVTTPAYYTIGPVNVYVINPDGGTAQGIFTYKHPDSKPYITNITKDGQSPEVVEINGREVRVLYMTYKGGNTVSIIGGDFRENARIQISNVATIEPREITYMLPTRLSFEMPAVSEDAVGKLHRVVVINEDGGSASSDEAAPLPIYIMFIKGETAPAITRLVPDKGPTSGGTRVRIEGSDFREGLKVFFGEIPLPEEHVQVVDYKTILVITPPHSPGRVEVKVENPDGELSNPSGVFTYISTPKTAAVVDPDDPTETTRITRISVEGGQRVKIKGTSFMPGARVVFAPIIKRIDDEEAASGTIIYIDGEPYLLEEGTDAIEVIFIDSETLTVVTPPGKLDSRGVIVVNPDGGASDIYDQIVYGLPELEAPTNVVAELIYDRYIKITWSPVEGAEGYEIFAIIDDNEMDFIGTTSLTGFVFTDLEPNTRYTFVVKALGPFGSSPPSARSNTVRTGRRVGPPDEDGELVEETIKERIGDTVKVIIGTADYRKETMVDLTDISYAGAKAVVVTLPAEVIARSNAGNIRISGKDFNLRFNPSVFDTSRVRQYRDRRDAGVRFELKVADGNSNSQGRTLLSTPYAMTANFYLEKDMSPVDFLNGHMEFTLEYDRSKADLRRITDIALYRYDEAKGDWEQLFARYNSYDIVIATTINRLGTYAIFGARR